MKDLNKIHRILTSIAIVATMSVATFVGCTKVDDTVGSNLIPDNQQMRAGFISLVGKAEKLDTTYERLGKFVETRLFQTDSVTSSNLGQGYIGAMYNDTLGVRKVGFLTQYLSFYDVDKDYFGYRPIFDSAQLVLSIDKYGLDTTSVQQFEIYEVINNEYLTQKPVQTGKTERDTIFYVGFNPEKVEYLNNQSVLSQEPIFTFELGGKKGPSTKAVTLKPTSKTEDFFLRLMLKKGKYAENYSIYKRDSLKQWFEEFKGLYIKPVTDPLSIGSGSVRGTIFSTQLNATSMMIYARNRMKEDPTLIQDTIGLKLSFYDQTYREHGNISINSIHHEYDKAATAEARVNVEDAKETNLNRPENPRLLIEGLGGVVSEIKFTQEFFKTMEREIEKANKATKQTFRTLAFNQALMEIHFPSGAYHWEDIDPMNPGNLIAEMNDAPERLGLYLNYKKLKAIPDYAYEYEKNYGIEIAYDGHINRSRGCYVMNITSYLQELWNNYLEQKEKTEGMDRNTSYSDIDWTKIEWDKIEERSIYLAPEAYDLFTSRFTVLQGSTTQMGVSVENTAPIKFDLAYNLIK